ncbi:hypothetical protein QQF64_006820 [Cirrhinus molitorella]|uniref:Cadherin domain-containing protein n=1 Tax=Cirrhinus molitorella TaxID=172907 RepID=A0ABR3M9N4_9TELE
MEQRRRPHQLELNAIFAFIVALLMFGRAAWAQIRYSVSEEQRDGAAVGNIAKDLGIDHRTLKERGFRIVSTSGESMFIVNQNDGVLYVNDYSSKYLQDTNYDGTLCHSIQYRSGDKRYMLVGPRMSIGSTIVPGSNGNTLVIPDRRRRYSGEEVSDHSLFGLDRYTGQIRTLRSFTETDEAQHKLLILVKDNGNVSLSATATLIVKVVEPKEAFAASDVKKTVKDDEENNVTFYLIITLGSVSVLFIISIIVLIVMQCSKSTDYSSKYLQDTNYDGTLCHSIQYRSGDKRYMLVGPRMSIGSTIVPGSNGNTLVIPDRRRRDSGEINLSCGHWTNTGIVVVELSWNQYVAKMEQRRRDQCPERHVKIIFIVVSLVFGRTAWAQIRYSISEEQKDGAAVGNVAKDLGIDHRTLKERGFRIVSASGESMFSVNQNDGVLYVNGKLDREEMCERSTPCFINLKIALENPLEIHYVTVDVADVNDHAPRFPEQEKCLEISETVLPGARFQLQAARDPDSGSNSVQTYKLSHTDYFRIEIIDRDEDGKAPVLILQKPLDREVTKSMKLQLTAFDGGRPPKSGTMGIAIDILDINDNAPVFTKDSYTVMLNENAPVGTIVLKVNATDLDEGQNGEVVYSLGHNVNYKLRKLFDVNPITGEIIVTGLLDFEIKDKYQIDIQASDKGIVPLTTDKIITIKIADINDNPPQIEVTSFSSAIPEDSKLGTTVALISVSDLDSEMNGRVTCLLPEDIPFKLMPSSQENTYSLVTTTSLDRETISRYDITLEAKDAGQPPLSSVKSITVHVSDVNDNVPEFSFSPYAFYVMENNAPGKSVFSVSASDKDADYSSKYLQDTNYDGTLCHSIQYRSGDKRYMLVGPRMSIGSTIAPGSNRNTLVIPDRRRRDSGELVMNAVDIAFTFAKSYVLRIWNIFERRFNFLQNATKGAFVMAPQTYIHGTGNAALERENPLEIHYVSIEIVDINDHAPTFPEKEKRLEISESALPGARFQLQAARDPDGGINSVQQYKLSHNDNFRIEVKDRGEDRKMPFLILQKPLDRETSRRYKLHLTALDGGRPPKSGTMDIIVDVLDVNDNTPVFTQEVYSVTLKENVPVGTTVIQVNATDMDDGPNGDVFYSFGKDIDNRLIKLFDLNYSTGEITVIGQIDFEQMNNFEIDIQASDKGSAPLTSDKSITIKIADVNDNVPEIEVTSFSSAVPENSKIGTTVALISISDLDSGVNGKVLCYITEDVPFRLTASSQDNIYALVTASSLDRETVPRYDITLVAKDSGQPPLSSVKTIIVQCSKSTDFSSKYLQDTNYDGTLCHSIQYRSGDKRYMLVGPRMSIGSTIAPGSNRNTLVIPDRRRRNSGEVQFLAWKIFERRFNFLQNATKGAFVMAPQTYIHCTGNAALERGDSLFTVNQNDGILSVNGKIDREEVCEKSSSCVINLKIALENPLEIHYVSIEIVDINDHAPTFPEKEKRLEIWESALPGTRYQLQAARDLDGGMNAVQQYKLSHNDNFRIEVKDRGEDLKMPFLILQKPLDRETNRRHKLVLTALDGGRPPKSGTMDIIVDVLDVNDNMPVFTQEVYSVKLQENVPVGTTVIQVNATDMDDGPNGDIFYSFGKDIDNRIMQLFDLNSSTGEMTVIGPLDFEKMNNFEIDIQASDKGSVPLTSDKSITIKIVDVNDNVPEIEVTSFSSAVPENSKIGTTVALISISDLDSGVNGKVLCYITEDVPFRLMASSQDNIYALVTASSLDRETMPRYDITLVAKDAGQPPLSSVKTITVQCSKSTDCSSKYLQDTNYDGTLCHSIQYRSGDKRYMLVGPRMSIGSTIAPGSNRNTLVIPDRRRRDSGEFVMNTVDIAFTFANSYLLRIGAFVMAPQTSIHGTGNAALERGDSLFTVNQNDGILSVNGKIDREEVCEKSSSCVINLKIALENPLEIHYVSIEIVDINDHAPTFPEKEKRLEISESALPGARYQLQAARDPDGGMNSVQQYKLSHNDNFRIEVKDRGEDRKMPFLILQKPLDRETSRRHKLVLTALDGGRPPKSGTMDIIVEVLDVNDNMPVFTQEVYSVTLQENVPVGTIVIQVNATDMDDGPNGEIFYTFGKDIDNRLIKLFDLNSSTGEMTVTGPIDFEEMHNVEIDIQASDKGPVPLTSDKSITIKIVDINDNVPEIEVTSFSSAVPEDSKIGTTVALISISDLDSGVNGKVLCYITEDVPFRLTASSQDNIYALVTASSLDRETVPRYDITLVAKDAGQPSLSSVKTITVQCSKSTDYSSKYLQDTNYDGTLCHSIQYRSGDKRYMLVGPRMSIGSTIAPSSNRNTLVIPDRRRRDSGEQHTRYPEKRKHEQEMETKRVRLSEYIGCQQMVSTDSALCEEDTQSHVFDCGRQSQLRVLSVWV